MRYELTTDLDIETRNFVKDKWTIEHQICLSGPQIVRYIKLGLSMDKLIWARVVIPCVVFLITRGKLLDFTQKRIQTSPIYMKGYDRLNKPTIDMSNQFYLMHQIEKWFQPQFSLSYSSPTSIFTSLLFYIVQRRFGWSTDLKATLRSLLSDRAPSGRRDLGST